MTGIVEKLYNTGDLSDGALKALIGTDDTETAELLRRYADETRQKSYGKKVFLRGLIEISSFCKNMYKIRTYNTCTENQYFTSHAYLHLSSVEQRTKILHTASLYPKLVITTYIYQFRIMRRYKDRASGSCELLQELSHFLHMGKIKS